MYSLNELLSKTVQLGASDLHLTVNLPPVIRKNKRLIKLGVENLSDDNLLIFVKQILGDNYDKYYEEGEFDTSYHIQGVGRFRVNIFKQKNSDAIAIRVIPFKVPTLDMLMDYPILREITKKERGLVLVTGVTGSGKSTTLAAMINEINMTKQAHIITLEDPIEFTHSHNQSIVNQREIGKDSKSYKNALKASLREDPDVILIGEMRDLETISVAITAAETGHLVFSTLHTIGAAKTIDRIIDVFPTNQQQQIRTQLASVLQAVISQQLVENLDGSGRVPALEIMMGTSGVLNLIREGKTHQIDSLIQTGSQYGMRTMDMSLVDFYRRGIISRESALKYSIDKDFIKKLMVY